MRKDGVRGGLGWLAKNQEKRQHQGTHSCEPRRTFTMPHANHLNSAPILAQKAQERACCLTGGQNTTVTGRQSLTALLAAQSDHRRPPAKLYDAGAGLIHFFRRNT